MIYIYISSRFIIELLHYITCAFYGYMFYLLFVFCHIRLFTGFIKHIFYGDSLFGCLIIYSSQLILTSTVPFWH